MHHSLDALSSDTDGPYTTEWIVPGTKGEIGI